ncbi:MAG: FtsQ-type POTRA domain-containing protein [Clostridia bacterium]|nr:FtsQ-type POTRA domain-containing protein [Clostridia bacterium]
MKPKKRRGAAHITAAAVIVVAALALLAVFAFSQVLKVRSIVVVGNRTLLREEVVTQSGVKPGDHLLGREVAAMEENLEKNRYIVYAGHEFDYKGTLTIRIIERMGRAVVNGFGLYYVTDESGVILENSGMQYPLNVAGPEVSGFSFVNNARFVVGEKLPVRDEMKLEKMSVVLDALDRTSMLSRTALVSVELFDNLYIMTSEGTKIELGEERLLPQKLLIAREVLSELEGTWNLKGTKIDVSNGTEAHCIPPELPTPTPVPTATPTIAPASTP